MSEEKKAGQFILSQLGMFNEAVVLFGVTIEPALLDGIDECVESFTEDNDWVGGDKLASDNSIWLAPKAWVTNPEEDEPECKAWFESDCIDDNDDYWSACFCDVATQGGKAGFMFSIDPGCFGGKTTWNASAKRISQDLISQLTNLGFQNREKGKFFLPVTLDNQQLAQSWVDDGEFTKDDDSFIPLRAALEKLNQAVPIFDQIMQACTDASPAN